MTEDLNTLREALELSLTLCPPMSTTRLKIEEAIEKLSGIARPTSAGFQDQTVLHDANNRGDCMRACVASILGLPIGDVPHFADAGDAPAVWDSFEDFFTRRGFEVLMLPGTWQPDCVYLASGKSPRGVSHMVLMQGGKLLHDPHPSRAGIVDVEWVRVIVPMDFRRAPRLEAAAAAEYERGRQDGMKQEHALWQMQRIGQEIEAAAVPELSYGDTMRLAVKAGLLESYDERRFGGYVAGGAELMRFASLARSVPVGEANPVARPQPGDKL